MFTPSRLYSIHGALAATTLGIMMLGIAWVSQHYYGFEPCTLCIEIRFWIACAAVIALASIVPGFVSPLLGRIMMLVSSLAYAAALFWSTKLVLLEHKVIEVSGCTPFPFYWKQLPLHESWPGMFASSGLCGERAMVLSWLSYSELTLVGMVFATFVSIGCLFNRRSFS